MRTTPISGATTPATRALRVYSAAAKKAVRTSTIASAEPVRNANESGRMRTIFPSHSFCAWARTCARKSPAPISPFDGSGSGSEAAPEEEEQREERGRERHLRDPGGEGKRL